MELDRIETNLETICLEAGQGKMKRLVFLRRFIGIISLFLGVCLILSVLAGLFFFFRNFLPLLLNDLSTEFSTKHALLYLLIEMFLTWQGIMFCMLAYHLLKLNQNEIKISAISICFFFPIGTVIGILSLILMKRYQSLGSKNNLCL